MKTSQLFTFLSVSLLVLLLSPVPASATIYSFDFEPKSGGPGTQVQVRGIVPPFEITIELGIARDTNQGYITQFEPIAVLGKVQAVAYQPGGAEAGLDKMVVIPSHKTDGLPITECALAIRLVDADGNQIFQTMTREFAFTPCSLPATGSANQVGLVIVIMMLLAAVLAGWLLRRRKTVYLG
jgi:LPXTG-motif cell wall-anchored protein